MSKIKFQDTCCVSDCCVFQCSVRQLWTLTLQTLTHDMYLKLVLSPLTLLRLWDDLWHHWAQNRERHDRQEHWHPHCGKDTTHCITRYIAGNVTESNCNADTFEKKTLVKSISKIVMSALSCGKPTGFMVNGVDKAVLLNHHTIILLLFWPVYNAIILRLHKILWTWNNFYTP